MTNENAEPKDQGATTAPDDLAELNAPNIEFLILADHAEAVNGKLYLMGGGWDRVIVPDFSQPVVMSFALGVLVPWHATNVRHTIQLAIEDLDRKLPVEFGLDAGFVAGRPPLLAEEADSQRILLAVSRAPVKFDQPGAYQAVARIVGGHEQRARFRLVTMPAAQIRT